MNLNKKQQYLLIIVSLFIFFISSLLYALTPKSSFNNNETSNQLTVNTKPIIFKTEYNNNVNGNISIPNEIVINIINYYANALVDNKPHNIHVSILDGKFYTKLELDILKIKTYITFNIDVESISTNKFKFTLSNLKIGKLNINNKIAKSLIEKSTKGNLDVRNDNSCIYIELDLQDTLTPLNITNLKINNGNTSFSFNLKTE